MNGHYSVCGVCGRSSRKADWVQHGKYKALTCPCGWSIFTIKRAKLDNQVKFNKVKEIVK